MRKITGIGFAVLLAASAVSAEDIAGKFALGFEQGVGAGGGTDVQGRGLSFKYCLSNLIAVTGVLGVGYSQMTDSVPSNWRPTTVGAAYKEDQDRIDYAAAVYGVLVLRRFDKVHLNGMTGLLFCVRGSYFEDALNQTKVESYIENSGGLLAKTDIHFRALIAPEIFLFPNFSLEYKYGLDIGITEDPMIVPDPGQNGQYVVVKRKRLSANTVGDLDLLGSASVHFYF